MAKDKTIHTCSECGGTSPRWLGKCPHCNAWNTLVEGVAEGLAREITQVVGVPTIGIGASAGCDGQILVTDDMLGLFDWTPKFVRRYADLKNQIQRAAAEYARDVKNRSFPGEAETYYAKKA